MPAGRERAQLKATQADTFQFFDGMAGLKQPVAERIAAGLR